PLKTMQDAIEKAKNDPSTFTWTSLGGAGAQDYTFRQLFRAIGVDVKQTRPVASKGGSEDVTLTAGGNVQIGADSRSAYAPLLKSNKLMALAVASPERFPDLPEVPTMAEIGHPNVQILFWFSVSAPPNTPDHVVQAWDEAISAVANDPKFKQTLSNIGMVPYIHTGREVRTMVETEKKVVESLWSK